MFTAKKIFYAAFITMFLTFGAAQAQDALRLERPETDYGRDDS